MARDAGRTSGHRLAQLFLFLRSDGLLIGYVEADDFAASQAAMAALDVDTRWQAEMAPLFAGTTPAEGFPLLSEVFHLEEPEEK